MIPAWVPLAIAWALVLLMVGGAIVLDWLHERRRRNRRRS